MRTSFAFGCLLVLSLGGVTGTSQPTRGPAPVVEVYKSPT